MHSVGQGFVKDLIDKYNNHREISSSHTNQQLNTTTSSLGQKVITVTNRSNLDVLTETGDYLLGKKLLGEEISVECAKKLLTTNQSVNKTKQTLFLGPGNLKRPDDLPFYLTEASRAIGDNLPDLPHQDSISKALALSSTVGTGYCAEHAANSLINHMGKLNDGDEIYLAMSEKPDHVWAEVKTKNGEIIVLDAWTSGSSILLEDFTYKDTRAVKIPLEHNYDELCQKKVENLAYINKHFSSERWDKLVDSYRKTVNRDEVELCEPKTTVSKAFKEKLAKSSKNTSEFSKFIQRISIYRELGANFKDSISEANKAIPASKRYHF